jgi:aminoglycoside 6'-N-acetyltransferase
MLSRSDCGDLLHLDLPRDHLMAEPGDDLREKLQAVSALVRDQHPQMLEEIHSTPEVARWWDAPNAGFPTADQPGATRLTIEVDGAVAGLIQYFEEQEPNYRHAAIDLFLDPALHGRGLGTAALKRVVRHLIDDRPATTASRSTPQQQTPQPSEHMRK